MQQFMIGKTYFTRSPGDHNCVVRATIVKRTAKTITTDKGETFRVKVWNDVEQFLPWGSYSMSPAIRADKEEISVPLFESLGIRQA